MGACDYGRTSSTITGHEQKVRRVAICVCVITTVPSVGTRFHGVRAFFILVLSKNRKKTKRRLANWFPTRIDESRRNDTHENVRSNCSKCVRKTLYSVLPVTAGILCFSNVALIKTSLKLWMYRRRP